MDVTIVRCGSYRALVHAPAGDGQGGGIVFEKLFSDSGVGWVVEESGIPHGLIKAALAVRAALYPELVALTVEDVCNQGA